MKLEIENSENGMNDLWLRIDNSFIGNVVRIKSFSEDDILNYFGNKIHNQFIKDKTHLLLLENNILK